MKILLALALFVLAGCANLDISEQSIYKWVKVDDPMPMEWRKVDAHYFQTVCIGPRALAQIESRSVACVHRNGFLNTSPGVAVAYSTMSEKEAKRVRGIDGLTIYAHEKFHADGWVHQLVVDSPFAILRRR